MTEEEELFIANQELSDSLSGGSDVEWSTSTVTTGGGSPSGGSSSRSGINQSARDLFSNPYATPGYPLVSERKVVWKAETIETSAQGIFAVPETKSSTGLHGGISFVQFTNETTGVSFSAEYSFVMKDLGGLMGSIGVTAFEFGVLRQSFVQGTGFPEVARSFQGIFDILTGSIPFGPVSISGSYIRGRTHWAGGSGSVGAGVGGGVASMQIDYRLLDIHPPGTPSPWDNLRYITGPF